MLYIYGKLCTKKLRIATDELDPYRRLAVADFETVFGAAFEMMGARWRAVEEGKKVGGVCKCGDIGIDVSGVGVLLV